MLHSYVPLLASSRVFLQCAASRRNALPSVVLSVVWSIASHVTVPFLASGVVVPFGMLPLILDIMGLMPSVASSIIMPSSIHLVLDNIIKLTLHPSRIKELVGPDQLLWFFPLSFH
jgi:hypothetical protein